MIKKVNKPLSTLPAPSGQFDSPKITVFISLRLCPCLVMPVLDWLLSTTQKYYCAARRGREAVFLGLCVAFLLPFHFAVLLCRRKWAMVAGGAFVDVALAICGS